MSYASDVVSNAQDGFEWSDLNTFKDNWKKYVCATVGGAVSGALGSFGSVGLSFVGGFVGNMIDNAYTFTDSGNIGNAIITSVLAGALSGMGPQFLIELLFHITINKYQKLRRKHIIKLVFL